MDKYILLNPGPVNVSERVRQALLKADMCHREEEYFQVQDQIRRKLLIAFRLAPEHYTTALISGSGTSALEMTVASTLSEGKKILVINNGVYGDRIAKIADIYNFSKVEIVSDWGKLPALNAVEQALKDNPDVEIVALVHHETTTGLINPVNAVGSLARKYNKVFLVDSISGLGGEDFDFKESQADYVVCTANKCIQGFPGMAFTIFKKKELSRLSRIPSRSLYLNLYSWHQSQEKQGTPFTPAVQIAYALEEALDELIEETVEKRIQRYHNVSKLLRAKFQDLGLSLYLNGVPLSNTITALHLPEGKSYESLHKRFKQKGFIIYAGQGNLQKTVFRIANMGEITESDVQKLIRVLEEVFKS